MSQVKIPRDYVALRLQEYARRGLTIEAITVALIEDDQHEIQRIRAAREEVKAKIPKERK